LTAVVGRICLDMLRSRHLKREDPLELTIPDFLVSRAASPEDDAILADSVGLALLVVQNTLTPAERLAFVLHDLFALPFDEIAPIIGRSSEAARQLASRARRRVKGAERPETDLGRQRELVNAFVAAAQAILAFIVARDRIAEIYVISSPERVEQLLDYRRAGFSRG
jgi:predicted RNA polymerase sigma factor